MNHDTFLIRAGSLNHLSGEPYRGEPNFSQSQRGIGALIGGKLAHPDLADH